MTARRSGVGIALSLVDAQHAYLSPEVIILDTADAASEPSTGVETRPPVPPFDVESARSKTRLAENGWNSRDPARVALAYTVDSRWRNRDRFLTGRTEIIAFLSDKWQREREYRLIKELWAFTGNRIAVRFAYECCTAEGQWFRSHGNENWEFDEHGLMRARHASINDQPIDESARLFHWGAPGPRPEDHPGLSDLGL